MVGQRYDSDINHVWIFGMEITNMDDLAVEEKDLIVSSRAVTCYNSSLIHPDNEYMCYHSKHGKGDHLVSTGLSIKMHPFV